jgi:hypothetical protein
VREGGRRGRQGCRYDARAQPRAARGMPRGQRGLDDHERRMWCYRELGALPRKHKHETITKNASLSLVLARCNSLFGKVAPPKHP